nr:hypothetical protein [Xanthomonas sp. LMG 8992]
MNLRNRPHNAFPGFTVCTTPELIGMRRTRAAATWISVTPGRDRGFLPGMPRRRIAVDPMARKPGKRARW